MRYQNLVGVLLLAFAAVFETAATERGPRTVAATPAAPSLTLRRTAPAQLPPEIMLDGHLLRAEEAIRERDLVDARAAMEQIQALQDEHGLEAPPEYHYRYAVVWNGLGAWGQSLASAVRYLELTGRDGDYYLDALTLMNRATAAIDEFERARDLRAAENARVHAAEARARAEAERVLGDAANAIAQMQFVPISPGRFRMGTNDRDSTRYRRTQVQVTQSYEIGRYEVTQSEWTAVMGTSGESGQNCERCPIVLWEVDEVPRFLSMLNTADAGNWTYRLPTEAEWEYAARAGEEGDRIIRDLDSHAWFIENSIPEGAELWRYQPVGLKRPNAFGLYDIFGNVQELTQDWYGPYPGGTLTDPTGHRSGVYPYYHLGVGTVMAQPMKVARGCDYMSSRRTCERGDRTPFESRTSARVGLRLVRVPR